MKVYLLITSCETFPKATGYRVFRTLTALEDAALAAQAIGWTVQVISKQVEDALTLIRLPSNNAIESAKLSSINA